MNTRAKSIKIIFDNSSEDNWEVTCGGGLEFGDAMRMIARAWKEYDEPKEPIEPLIKDKKMRQCVKLWTEINEFKGKLMYSEDDDYCSFYERDSQEELLFLGRKCPRLNHAVCYTIAELCGNSKEENDEA